MVNIIGGRIREQRTKLNCTQKTLAEKINVSTNTVTAWECGRKLPSIDTCMALAVIFNVTMDYLCGREKVQEATYSAALRKLVEADSLVNFIIKKETVKVESRKQMPNESNTPETQEEDQYSLIFKNSTVNTFLAGLYHQRESLEKEFIDKSNFDDWIANQLENRYNRPIYEP
jgi:transcriptional regulator with XRE-family HTH domain